MITKFTYPDLDKVIDLVKRRQIGFIKILKQKGDYYIEYKTCTENKSSKVLDLLVILDDFRSSNYKNTLSNFYLYYNIDTNQIIFNISEICEDSNGVSNDKSEPYDISYDSKVEILNSLSIIKSKILESDLNKITLSDGKKRMSTTYENVLDKLITDIKTNL